MDEIILYSTPTCTYCKILKRYLEQKNITFKEINIFNNEKEIAYLREKANTMSVPVLKVNDKFIIGFKKKEIDKALSIK